jgi:tetratricopeptide (TPR) repeat protein
MEELLAELESFAKKTFFGYAGGKAYSIIGAIHSERKDWPAAETAWAAAAQAAKKTYLAPLAYFNAGAAAEEQGKTEEAIGYYASSLEFTEDFPGAPHAQFSIGRLRESQGDNAAAIEAYQAVISGWTYDMVWASLAHSRIIALELK